MLNFNLISEWNFYSLGWYHKNAHKYRLDSNFVF